MTLSRNETGSSLRTNVTRVHAICLFVITIAATAGSTLGEWLHDAGPGWRTGGPVACRADLRPNRANHFGDDCEFLVWAYCEMLDVGQRKGVYRALRVGDVTRTGLPAATYDLCIQSLADEHLADLRPLYAETARVTRRDGVFVIVGFHPQFLMAGVPTHFDRAPGEPVTIRSYVHLFSDHVKAARAAGWSLREMEEGLVDEAWLRRKPKWDAYRGLPISFAMVWRADA